MFMAHDKRLDQLLTNVAKHYGVTVDDLRGESREPFISFVRGVVAYVARRQFVGFASYTMLGRLLGRDHSTVMTAVRRVQVELRTNTQVQSDVKILLEQADTPKTNTNITEQVAEFHEAFGYPTRSMLHQPTTDPSDQQLVRLRLRLVAEEVCEFIAAHGVATFGIQRTLFDIIDAYEGKYQVDLVEVADAAADVDYVIEGTRLSYGIPRQPVADEVHRSNMAKRGGLIDEQGKLKKPPNWKPPDIAGVLMPYRKQENDQ